MIEDEARQILQKLNKGLIKICIYQDGEWLINTKGKEAILNYMAQQKSTIINGCYDKVSLKFADWSENDFKASNIRVVPGAVVRYGSYIGENSVIMPSFINIGSYIGEKSMIDSGATIGSCAHIGKKCHISSNVVIGGVLEPLNARPVIIEDEVFIGANSSITEGIIVKKGSVIASGVHISQSTKIYDAVNDQMISNVIPPYSVVVSGYVQLSITKKYSTTAAIIVKKVNEDTRSKTSINNILRQ